MTIRGQSSGVYPLLLHLERQLKRQLNTVGALIEHFDANAIPSLNGVTVRYEEKKPPTTCIEPGELKEHINLTAANLRDIADTLNGVAGGIGT